MAQPVNMADIMALSVPERILLVQDIWDSIADEPEAWPPLTQAQLDEIDRRIDAHEANPEAGCSWEEVKARIQNRGST
jgi:putative addiction module component (TIGR02574 family)